MIKKNPDHAKILAFGSAFPDKVVTNFDMEKIVDTSDSWITERTGIKERRMLSEGENNSDFATLAALRALKKANLQPNDIEMIIVCTNTPDRNLPAMACEVQRKLGITNNCPAWDIIAACAGWIAGITTANAFVRSGQYKNILVLGSEALSRHMNWQDRTTCVLFGDGCGASIVSAADKDDPSQIFSTHMFSDGQWSESLQQPSGGSAYPVTEQSLQQNLHKIRMNGGEVFKLAVRGMAESSLIALEQNGLQLSDIAWFVPHQANLRIIEAVAKKLNMSMDRVLLNVHKYGNTSAATIPTCIDEFIENGKVKKGDLVLMSSFGGGVTWGSALIRV